MVRAGSVRDLDEAEVLSLAGRQDQHEYFVLEGVLHRAITGHDGESVTTAFYASGSVITPHFARTRGGRSLFSIAALTEARVFQVPVSEFDGLRSSHDEVRVFGMRVVERELMDAVGQSTSFREFSARERLIALRKAFPCIENQVSHTIIASYLGITPVSLSRLRNEMARTT